MIMKVQHYICLILLLAAFGCEKDLEPTVYNRLSTVNFPQTVADAEVLVNGIYGEFRGDNAWYRYSINPEARLMLGEYGTEECWMNWEWANTPQMNFDYNPNYDLFTNFYGRMVPVVTKATAVIAQLKEVSFDDTEAQNRLIAEVKACRALWLYDLDGFYGQPQVVLDPEAALNPQQLYYPPKLSAEEFLAFVETDLLEAMAALPVQASEYGRFTKGAAMTILLKFYMRYHAWEKAANLSQEIMNLHQYELLDDYTSIWSINNERNKEIIFALGCIAENNPNTNLMRAHVLPADYVSPNGAPVVAYSGYRLPWSVYDSFDDADIRKKTMVKDYYVRSGSNLELVDGRATQRLINGALPLKYDEDRNSDGTYQGNDLVILRYADVLLLRAEALNKLNGLNQESVDLVNEIRDRAFLGNASKRIQLADFASPDAFDDYLLQERLWEFCFEGERREDLIRHGKYISYAGARGKNAQAHHVRYPIPMSAVIEGQGNIKQNAEY